MHPVQAIIDRIASLLAAELPEVKVYKHRVLSLSEDNCELPAISVQMGADDPLAALHTMAKLGSALTVTVTIADRASDEVTLCEFIIELRRRIHTALMADRVLGFDWFSEVGCLGAAQPNLDATSEYVSCELATRWQVAYQADRTNPTA